jgi:tol-pal system protein YbgF
MDPRRLVLRGTLGASPRSRLRGLRPLRAPLALVLVTSTVAACGFSKDEGEKLKNETYALMTQVNAMQQALTELQKKHDKLAADVESTNKTSRRSDADFGVQLDEALQQVSRLKGLVETFQDRLQSNEAAVNRAQEEADARFKQLQEDQRVQQIKSQEEKQKAVEFARKKERLMGDPSALFEEAQKMIGNGDTGGARELLSLFSSKAKNDKTLKNRLPDAEYLVGETYFAEGKYQAAAAAYNNVRKDYAKSPKAPDALYRLGLCFEKLGLKDDAKLFYDAVVKQHPKSSVARDAKARRDALK